MISPLLDPSRKPLNALRVLRRKTAHFIPSAGAHTKGSYSSTTTAFCAPLKKKKKRRWAPGRLLAEPRGSRFSDARRLRCSSCFALRRRSAGRRCGGGISACLLGSEQQAARDQQVAVDRALHRDSHWPLIQAPTLPITAMTATSRRPRSTVYSTKEAPSSSLPRRRTRVRAFDMRHS